MTARGISLFAHLAEECATLPPAAKDAMARVLRAVAEASVAIQDELAHAALRGRLGETGSRNQTGDSVKKLDDWGHEAVVAALEASGACAALVSEESEEPVEFGARDGLVVCCDPVDGSSSLDVGGAVGTVFGVRASRGQAPAARAALASGREQLAAGYVLYGPTTLFVYSIGRGVHGFTLDLTKGEFILTHPGLRVPPKGKVYGINEGNVHTWHPGQRAFVEHLRTQDKASGRPYSLRYSGAMVADVHRVLHDGGIFMYPADHSDPAKPKPKLRLLYEVAPIAFIAEQAGGRASTGTGPALDLVATDYHQRAAILVGSAADVALAEEFYARR
jgi:fructose-1,6-bisphosphatase I